jgi:hypothetical protein
LTSIAPQTPEAGRELGGHARQQAVGREGRDDDLVDVGGLDAGVLERVKACDLGEIGQRLLAVEMAALADSGAAHDPVVVRVEIGLEVSVRDDAVGER